MDSSFQQPRRAGGQRNAGATPTPVFGNVPSIEQYEPRLALSASLPIDWIPDSDWPASAVVGTGLGYCEPLPSPLTSLGPTSLAAAPIPLDVPVPGSLRIDPLASPDLSASNANLPLRDAQAIRELFGIDGAGQTVAVIDSGVAWDHYGFSEPNPNGKPLVGYGVGYRVVGGWDFAEDDSNPYDDGPAGYHGTHVAGLIGGDYQDYQGIAPQVDLVALRVFDDFGKGSVDWIESALQWVIDHRNAFENPITTVNLSLGVYADADSQALAQLDEELAQLREAGIVVVAAAGNSFDATRPDALAYPASHPLVAAVSSVDAGGMLSGFSQRHDGVLAVGGENVLSSVPEHVNGYDGRNDDFQISTGTSMASPQLAGAAVLVRQAMEMTGREATPDSILQHLHATAITRTDQTTGYSYSQIDLLSAIETLVSRGGNSSDDGGGHDEAVDNQAMGEQGSNSDLPASMQWIADGVLQVKGTSGADQITVDLSSGVKITVNSTLFAIDRPLDQLVIQGGGGANSLEIISSGTGGDRVIMRAVQDGQLAPGGELENAQIVAHFSDFQSIRYLGSGGAERVTLFDSPGDDLFEASPDKATLSGKGFHFLAENVANVFAHGTVGGLDKAFLYDSAGDDLLAIRHQFTSLRGDNLFRLAYGFEQVYAFSNQGGFDQANLYDSPADDTLSASQHAAWISSRDYYAGARGFDVIRAESSAGGNDIARLYAGDPHTQWSRSGTLLQMIDSNGQIRSAQGFSQAESLFTSQTDSAATAVRAAAYAAEQDTLRQLFASLDES